MIILCITSLQLICQSLRELAITKAAAPNANPKVVGAAVAAAKGASAPLPELTAAINQVASNMDGVYFLTKLGNPSLDPFRHNCFIHLNSFSSVNSFEVLLLIVS